ncbi:hypothetical protein BN1723_004288 [Verticillium longisporum]|uniref:Uncharacterized protein n=1 Tax=Verticillium longisporum TaxID=100787 RepID=A0A0G4MSN8_VERLO|nr:hypothetical protein BN1723_004288 [Verticillium longisporum]
MFAFTDFERDPSLGNPVDSETTPCRTAGHQVKALGSRASFEVLRRPFTDVFILRINYIGRMGRQRHVGFSPRLFWDTLWSSITEQNYWSIKCQCRQIGSSKATIPSSVLDPAAGSFDLCRLGFTTGVASREAVSRRDPTEST